MKNILLHICLGLGLLASAQAQTVRYYHAHVDFDFNIGANTLPAGDYAIGLASPAAGNSALSIYIKSLKYVDTFNGCC